MSELSVLRDFVARELLIARGRRQPIRVVAVLVLALLPSVGHAGARDAVQIEPGLSADGLMPPATRGPLLREVDRMPAKSVAAEVMARPEQAVAAARALQRLGFRVRHVGATISVEGPESLWRSVFNVSFEARSKDVLPGVPGGERAYDKATVGRLRIPEELQPLISDVAFVEPPEFH